MNSLEPDYKILYRLQDKFLQWWVSQKLPFYLTGGTALGRFFLNHRYSDDLDFFVNADSGYGRYLVELKKSIEENFLLNNQLSLFSDDFTRFFIVDGDVTLKVEFVNDVKYYPGQPLVFPFGLIDRPINILANKLTAVVGRDEPKDVFDLIHLSLNYAFNWQDVFFHAKEKSVINEIEVGQRLHTFPVDWLKTIKSLSASIDMANYQRLLEIIADDFLFGKNNSLGVNRIDIVQAQPQFFQR